RGGAARRRRPPRGHRASRPVAAPERGGAEGRRAGRRGAPPGPLVPNLPPAGLAWAARVGGPREAFRRIAAFLNSPDVQETWAPAFGRSRVVPVPLGGE